MNVGKIAIAGVSMDTAYVTTKGQLVIPGRIRRKVHGAKNARRDG